MIGDKIHKSKSTNIKSELTFTVNRLREYRNALITDYMVRNPNVSPVEAVEKIDDALKLVSSGLKNIRREVS